MPPSLRADPSGSISHRSLGHFRPRAGAPSRRGLGSSASHSATPTASDSPDSATPLSGARSEQVSEAPGADCHARPSRPRPPVCVSATSRHGASAVSRGPNARLSTLARRSPLSCAGSPRAARAASSRAELVDATLNAVWTCRPGSMGCSCACNASACNASACKTSACDARACSQGGGAGGFTAACVPASCRDNPTCRSGIRTAFSAWGCTSRR